jgi:hypothetical protein
MALTKERQLYDGEAAKFSKEIKARSSFSGKHTIEDYVQDIWGEVFDYDNLNKGLKKLVDWFFDANLPASLEYEGLTVDEMSKKLTEEHLPQGFNLEKLQNWISGIKEKNLEKRGGINKNN